MLSLLSNQYAIWVFGAAVAAAITLLLLVTQNTLGILLDPMRRRLRLVRHTDASAQDDGGMVTRIGDYFSPRSQQERDTLSQLLVCAGWRNPNALPAMHAAKLALALIFAVAVFVGRTSFPELNMSQSQTLLAVFGGAFAGWFLPNWLLRVRIRHRQDAILAGFPDALDLLVACTEAGLGLNAAIERVAEEIPHSHPDLADELALVNAEIRAGVDRSVALRNLSQRVAIRDIRGLITLLMHAMKFGTSIADTLRNYAEELRDKRVQRVEELAATLGTKLIFPLVACIFPSFFLVAIGPAIIGVLKVLAGSSLGSH